MNLIGPQMARPTSRPLAVPLAQKARLRSTRFAPTDAVADRRMRRRHRLTVHPDLLPQAPRDPRLRIGELDPLGANPAVAAPDPPLRIDQRDRMRRPRHIVPGPLARRSHATRPPSTPAALVPPDSAALHPDGQPAVGRLALTLRDHHPKSRQPQNPRTIAPRSHRSSLVVWHIKRR